MTHTLETAHPTRATGHGNPFAGMPRGLAEVMRRELPDLATEIIAEIRSHIPEYARPMNGPYGQAIRLGVEHALTAFVDQVANPHGSHEARDAVCRRLGQYEAHEGRSLDSLQAAYRIGTRVAWHRMMKVAQQYKLSLAVVSNLADALFDYIDELAALSRQGYLEAQARSANAVDHWRRRLLRLILERPPAPHTAIVELAGLANWPVPEQATAVAVRIPADKHPQCDKTLLDADVLAELDAAEPHLLIPGPLTAQRGTMLQFGLSGMRTAVAPTMRLAQAAESLRWARQALALAEAGAIEAGPIV
ncbi:MAG: PucR family transcriptional regulator, partial [Micromonosporaceae bacterium]|nr:PucR family transcriptional regulator [Micromonosporaceae bacterium]